MKSRRRTPISARPYQLLCLFCAAGDEDGKPVGRGVARLRRAIGRDPDVPVMLRCNAGDVFAYQDPGTEEDTPEGSDFNLKRDMDILRRLNLPPGSVLPARMLLQLVLKRLPTVTGICAYDTVTSDAWKGCARACDGSYERGREKGIGALVPRRSAEAMQAEKAKSMAVLLSGKGITIRPHILLCAVCQYGNGVRPPFADDNLPEFLDFVLNRSPALPVTLVRGADWMMCAPCPWRVPSLSACVTGVLGSGGLYNEVKDLNVLQAIGLTYGTTMTARDIFLLIFENVPRAYGVCALKRDDLPEHSIWCDGCGKTEGPFGYEKGRELLLKRLGRTGSQ